MTVCWLFLSAAFFAEPRPEFADLVGRAGPGQVLAIPDGVYAGFVMEARLFDPPVTFKAVNPGKVLVVEGSSQDKSCWIRKSRGIRFEGITFIGKRSHAMHVDGDPWPDPDLSEDLAFNDCLFISLGPYYCAKISQARGLVFDRCYFYVPERSEAAGIVNGGMDAVAVDDLFIRYCRFDNRRSDTCTLMVKGGSRNVLVRDSVFDCPGAPTLLLAGSTDPIYRVRPDVEHELENLTFQDNVVHFRDSEGENVHGTWDSLGRARFLGNQFHNVGQILFVAKRTYDDLRPCADIEFSNNTLSLRKSGFASPYNALVTSQSYLDGAGKESFLLPYDQFHAMGNIVVATGKDVRPDLEGWIKSGFAFTDKVPPPAEKDPRTR